MKYKSHYLSTLEKLTKAVLGRRIKLEKGSIQESHTSVGGGGLVRENFTGWWVPSEAVTVAAQAAKTPRETLFL